MVLIAPIDTGLFEMACNSSEGSKQFPIKLDCDAWKPPIAGTYEYVDHIILACWGAWSRQFNTTVEEQAVQMFGRSALAGNYLGLPQLNPVTSNIYYEANIL